MYIVIPADGTFKVARLFLVKYMLHQQNVQTEYIHYFTEYLKLKIAKHMNKLYKYLLI